MALRGQAPDFWMEFLIDLPTAEVAAQDGRLYQYLTAVGKDDLVYLAGQADAEVQDGDTQNILAQRMCGTESGPTIMCLKKLLEHRGEAISELWRARGYRIPGLPQPHPLSMLVSIYQRNPAELMDVFVFASWVSRGATVVYTTNGNSNTAAILGALPDLTTEMTRLAKVRFKQKGTCEAPGGTVVMLYREDPPKVEPGFEEPVRLIGAKSVMFQVDGRTLRVRSRTKDARDALAEAAGGLAGVVWTERPDDPFSDYDPDEVARALREGGRNRAVEVLGITYAQVPLNKVAPVTIGPCEADIADVIPTFIGLSPQLVAVKSLVDVSRIGIRMPNERGIRWAEAKQYRSGEVIFAMPDHGLLPRDLEQIETGFMERFGVPLNQPINHTKFLQGRVDAYDYLFSAEYMTGIPDHLADTLTQLREVDRLIDVVPEVRRECRPCNWRSTSPQDTHCPKCGTALQVYEVQRVQVNEENVFAHVRDTFHRALDWKMLANNRRTNLVLDGGEKLPVFKLHKKDMSRFEVSVYVAFSMPSAELLQKLQSQPESVFVVYVGKAATGKQRDRLASVDGETIGRILASNDADLRHWLEPIFQRILATTEARLAAATRLALERVESVTRGELPVGYTSDDFEKDGYLLLKGVIPETALWGAEMRMKNVPDGLCSYEVERGGQGRVHKAGTCDYKLNENMEGYQINTDERRKLKEYISAACESDSIRNYTGGDLNWHILIGNKFRDGDPRSVREYLEHHLPNWQGRVKWLTTDVLSEWHMMISANAQTIKRRWRKYYQKLDWLLEQDGDFITLEQVTEAIASVMDGQDQGVWLDNAGAARDIAGD